MALPADATAVEAFALRAQIWYPLVLLTVFGVSAALYSVWTVKQADKANESGSDTTGPGGRPLPSRTSSCTSTSDTPLPAVPEIGQGARRLFEYLLILVVLTFVASGVNLIVHAIDESHGEGWWCTDETTVRFPLTSPATPPLSPPGIFDCLSRNSRVFHLIGLRHRRLFHASLCIHVPLRG